MITTKATTSSLNLTRCRPNGM